MQLRFHDLSRQKPIPFLVFVGPQEVETVEVAAQWRRRAFVSSYFGRSALIRTVDLRRVKAKFEGVRFPGYTDRQIIPRLEGVLTETGKKRVELGRLASIAYHERYNHESDPTNQRLRLIEDHAELAIDALRNLVTADPEQVERMWASQQGIEPIAVASELVTAIDLAYANPIPV